MSKYIELIDKYRIEQRTADELSEYGSDMNPPNYIWADNTGELVRCGDCKYWNQRMGDCVIMYGSWLHDDYCSKGEKKKDADK